MIALRKKGTPAMAKLLVIRAHPLSSESSQSMRLTDEFVRVYTDTHPDDDVLEQQLYNLAVPEIDLDLLNAWKKLEDSVPFVRLDEVEQNKVTLFSGYTDQFLAMDKIVIANPLWNLQVPTRLKAWIDCVCVAGRTFRYTEAGEAEGLVRGKKLLHIQTAGAVYGGNDPASQYIKGMFTFLGVEDVQYLAAEGMDHDPARADDIMADALRRVADAARAF